MGIEDFVNVALDVTNLIAAGLVTQFEIDFNDLEDVPGNISLHDLVNSGVVTLEELVMMEKRYFSD